MIGAPTGHWEDPWGLRYTRPARGLAAHYPHRQKDGTVRYGAGLPFDPRPELRRTPTSERSVLWRAMLELP